MKLQPLGTHGSLQLHATVRDHLATVRCRCRAYDILPRVDSRISYVEPRPPQGWRTLVVGTHGGELRLHDPLEGEVLDVEDGHTGPVTQLRVHDDEQRVGVY